MAIFNYKDWKNLAKITLTQQSLLEKLIVVGIINLNFTDQIVVKTIILAKSPIRRKLRAQEIYQVDTIYDAMVQFSIITEEDVKRIEVIYLQYKDQVDWEFETMLWVSRLNVNVDCFKQLLEYKEIKQAFENQ
jgi:hypothetical protein